MLRWTTNLITNRADEVSPNEIVSSVNLATYVGQSDERPLRLLNDSDNEVTTLIYSVSPFVLISATSKTKDFGLNQQITVAPNSLSDTVWLQLKPDIDHAEVTSKTLVIADGASLTVNYSIYSAFDRETETPLADRYLNQEQLQIVEQFQTNGQTCKIQVYYPINKPISPIATSRVMPTRLHSSLWSVSEWCNPRNGLVGYRLMDEYYTKAFIGDFSVDTPFQHNIMNDSVGFKDTSQILLPPDFIGFARSENPRVAVFNFAQHYIWLQHTVFLLLMNDQRYHITNIRKQFYYPGQFLYYHADLFRLQMSSGQADTLYSPFNQIWDTNGKQVAFIKAFADLKLEDPYMMEDPYSEDPYCNGERLLAGEKTAIYHKATDSIEITDWRPF